ncbi:MAG TPA: hypothetical protein VGG33_06450, partial [Polyangia bacterium]
MRTTVFLLLAALSSPTSVLADDGPAAQSVQVHEWMALEAAPGWMNVFRITAPERDTWKAAPRRFSVGGVGTLRLLRRNFSRVYWTPAQLGVGVARE